ncbi:19567_t:CDS:1, partial [Cetraspora pellucida]
MFEESGFEVYESHEFFIEYRKTEQQKNTENRRTAMAELTKRVHDKYWYVEET